MRHILKAILLKISLQKMSMLSLLTSFRYSFMSLLSGCKMINTEPRHTSILSTNNYKLLAIFLNLVITMDKFLLCELRKIT